MRVPVIGILVHRRNPLMLAEAERFAHPVLDILELLPGGPFAFRKVSADCAFPPLFGRSVEIFGRMGRAERWLARVEPRLGDLSEEQACEIAVVLSEIRSG